MPKGRFRRQEAWLRRWAKRCVTESLESRVLLSGAHEQDLLNAIELALQPGNSGGLVAFNSRLTDSSALGSNLAVVGTGLSAYNPGTILSPSLSQITGTYATLATLATALGHGTGVTVSATRDLTNDVQIDVSFNVTSTLNVPLAGSFGVNLVDPGTVAMSMNLQESITIGAYWDSHTSSAQAYINASSAGIQVSGTATGFTYQAYPAEGQLGFLEFDTPTTPTNPNTDQNSSGSKFLSTSVAFSPIFNFALNTQPPIDSTESAARLTMGQLNSVDVSNLVTTQIAQGANSTLTVNLTTPLASSASQIVFTWTDAGSPTLVTSTLTTDPNLTNLNGLQAVTPQAISQGLDEAMGDLTMAATNTVANNPFNEPLPIVGTTINDLVNWATVYSQATSVTDPAPDPSGGVAPPFTTDEQLIRLLAAQLVFLSESASGGQLLFGLSETIAGNTTFTPTTNGAQPALVLGDVVFPLVDYAEVHFTFGVVGSSNTFFVKDNGQPDVSVEVDFSKAFTEPVGNPQMYSFSALLNNFLSVDLGNSTFTLNATGAITLHDPQTDNPATPGMITADELAAGPQPGGADPANPAVLGLSGTASMVLDLRPDFVYTTPGQAPQAPPASYTFTWNDLSSPATYTVSSSGDTNYYTGFNSLSASNFVSAIQELPTLLNALSDQTFLGSNLSFLGPDLGSTMTLGTLFNTDLQSSGILTGYANFQFLVKDLQQAFGASNVNANLTADGFELLIDVQQTYNGGFAWQVNHPLSGAQLQATGTVPGSVSYLGAISLDVVLSSAGDALYLGSDTQINANVLVNAANLSGPATVGNMSVSFSGGSAEVEGTDIHGNLQPGQAAKITIGTPSGQRVALPPTVVKPDEFFGTMQFAGAARLTLPFNSLPNSTSPKAQFDWSNLGSPASLILTPTGVGNLSSTTSFATTPITNGINSLLAVINDWENSSILNTNIPFINKTIGQLVNFAGNTSNAFSQVEAAASAGASPSDLNSKILAVTLPTGMSLTATSNDNPGNNAFEYQLSINEPFSSSLPFNLGAAAGNIFSLQASVSANVTFSGTLVFGFDPSDGFYLVGSSNSASPMINLQGSVSANFAQFLQGTFGPITIGVSSGGASASLGLALNLTPPGDNGNKISTLDLTNDGLSIIQSTVTGGTGQVNFAFGAHIGSDGPGITSTFSATWDPTRDNALEFGPSNSTDPTDGFGPIKFDLGEFVNSLVGPLLSEIKKYDPLPPSVADALNYKIPVIDMTPAQILGDELGDPDIATLLQIAGLVTDLGNLPGVGDAMDLSQYISGSPSTGDTGTPGGSAPGGSDTGGNDSSDYSAFSDFASTLQNDYDISLPFLANPQQSLVDTLLGKDVDLVEFKPDGGHVSISASYETPQISIPLFSIGIASANAFFSAGLSATIFANIDIGLSTRGILGQGMDGAGAIQDGFFVGDTDQFQAGVELEGHVTIGGEIDLFGFLSIASISGSLGPYGEIGARVNSLIPKTGGGYVTDPQTGLYEIAGYNGAPAGDGRAYLDEIEYIADHYGPLCAVMPGGQIGLQLTVNASIGFTPFKFSTTLLNQQFPIANFDYPCVPQAADLAFVSGDQLIMRTQGMVGGQPIDETAGYNISSSVEDDDNGNPIGIVIVESDSSNIYYEDFSFAQLSGVNSVVMEGSNGNDVFSFDPKLSLAGILPTAIQYLTIYTNAGNDIADLSSLTPQPGGNSNLLGVTIHGGNGNDTIKGTYAPDQIYVGSGKNYVFTGTSSSEVFETSGTDTISGGNGNITVHAGSGPEQILLGDGDNIVYAGSGKETIDLGSGKDLITAGTGQDTIAVGDGNDKIYGDTGGSTISTGAGQDIIYGGAGNDSITAGGGNDFIDPGTGTDHVDGGTGHTTLAISADANQTLTKTYVDLGAAGRIHFTDITYLSLTGGPSNNTFDISAWIGGPVAINGNGGTDTIADSNDVNFILSDASLALSNGEVFSLTNIEQANLTGGASDNTFDVSGWTGSGTINGNGGNDTIVANNVRGATLTDSLLTRSGDGQLTLSGIAQADLSTYTVGSVNINAAAFDGAVALYGQGNSNTLIGGTGSDYLYAGPGTNNTLTAHGTTDNQLFGATGSHDILNAGPGQNLINGSTGGFDTITTAGASHVYTPGGNESINAQSGNAIVYAFGGGDSVNVGASTTDTILHPGDAGTQASDFVAPTGGDPWGFPELPAVQTSTLPAGPDSKGQWIQYASSASGGGVSNSSGIAIEPSVTSDSAGDEFIAWADNRTGVYEIYVAEHTASGWEELAGSAQFEGISNSNVNATRPSITLNSAGAPEVVWTQTNASSTDIFGAYFNAGANSWQALGSSLSAGGISNTGAADDAQIVNTASGPVVAWLNSNNGNTNVFARSFNGTNWNPLGTNSTTANGISNQNGLTPTFSLATDGNKIAVAWTQIGTSAGNSIYLLQYSAGNWTAVNGSSSGNGISGGNSAAEPSVAYAGGTLYAAWAANTDGTTNIVAAGNNGSGWNPISIQTPSSAGINQVSRGAASDPVLAANGSALDLVWLEDRLPDTPDDAIAIYANRLVSGSFVYQLPGDSSFDGILGRSTSLSQPVTLALAVDGSGHPYVSWGDDSSGSSQIYSLADTLNVAKIIYVNDSLTVTDFYTTAGGYDQNSGLTPDKPLATLGAALALATAPGDVILVDGGSYTGFTINSSSNGVIILGSPAGNSQITQLVALSSVNNVSLDSLELSAGVTIIGGAGNDLTNDIGGTPQQMAAKQGGTVTINGSSNTLLLDDAFAGLTISGSTAGISVLGSNIAGNGVTVSGPATNLLIGSNKLASLTLNAISQGTISDNNIYKNGLTINAAFSGAIAGNFIHGANVGVTYSASAPLNGNEIFDNKTGVIDTVNSNTAGLGFVAGSAPNFIFDNSTGVNLSGLMQDQSITSNDTGVSGFGTLGGTSLDLANYIANNLTGIKFTGTVQYNDIANNTISFAVTNGELIDHNIIYGTTGGPNIETNGATNVEIINNTFYSTAQNNIQIDGGSSDVEVLNNILWTSAGYDLYVADNSRVGFFSDYNDLFTTGSGLIVHYLEDFSDVLDWQDDVDLYDLHSIGTTVMNPTAEKPAFVDLSIGDFAIYPAAAGIRATSPTVGTADPGTDLGLPPSETNLISNPSFESGVTGWTVNPGGGTLSSSPGAFNGSSFFYAGSVASGFAQQTINLVTAGYSATQIDAGTLDVSFGGRIRSANESVADQGEIILTFYGASNNVLSTATVLASNVNDRWELVSGRVHIPVGARSVMYGYQSTRQTGSTDDSYLDGAFLYVLPNTVSNDMGAFGNTVASLAHPVDESIHLISPDLYVNWTLNQTHAITWATFDNTGDAPVKIDLYQQTMNGLVFYKTIIASTPDTGAYPWIPANTGLTYGMTGLVIEVTLVGNSAIHDKSTEGFTIPANGTNFYINDGSTTNDQYTGVKGSNRATGLSPGDPLPLLTTLLRTYSVTLGGTDTVYVDNGTYEDFAAVEISGNPAIGSGQGVTILGPTNAGTQAIIAALGFTAPAVIDVNDATFVTLKNLTLTGGNYGLWIRNASPNFVGSSIAANNNLLGGIRIESDSVAAAFDHLTTDNNTGDGFYAGGSFISLTHSVSIGNSGDGFDLANAGNAVLTNDIGASNSIDGLFLINNNSGTTTMVGNANLALGLGNQFYSNGLIGIYVQGFVAIDGNVVYSQTATNDYGIDANSTNTVITENVVYNNYNGIIASGGSATYNTVYNNTNIGLEADSGATITGNTAYGNYIGIKSFTPPNTSTGPYILNNLVYNNTAPKPAGSTVANPLGIWLIGGNAAQIYNNTVYQPSGTALELDYEGGGVIASNIKIEDNILWTQNGVDISVDPTSETGFHSDYNDLYYTGSGAVGKWENIQQNTLAAWLTASNSDSDSLSIDPLFVNIAGGDFHLQSTTGSYQGGTLSPLLSGGLPVANAGTLTAYGLESPGIDRGDATFAFNLEPAPNGGYINLGFEGDTAQASESPTSYVLVLKPSAGQNVIDGQPFTIVWRSQNNTGTVNIDLLYNGNDTPITTNAPNSGSYAWNPNSITPNSGYVIQVTRNAAPTAVGDSQPFNIEGPITQFYVNDAATGGVFTTAGGSDSNSGLDPAHPKATIQALLSAYSLGAGDTILVDQGTYNLSNNLVLTAANNGLTIQGVPGDGTILNRSNTATNTYVFDLQAANGITLNSLTITGGYYGINAAYTTASDTNITIENSNFTGSQQAGLFMVNNFTTSYVVTGDLVTNNSFHDMISSGSGPTYNSGLGMQTQGDQLTISNNTFYHVGTGLSVSSGDGSMIIGNIAHNTTTGILADTSVITGNIAYNNNSIGIEDTGASTVSGNTAHDNVNFGFDVAGGTVSGNIAYNNATGFNIASDATVSDNLAYNNTTSGISGGNGDKILGNVTYGNGIGISINSAGNAADRGPTVENNLAYNNHTAGISEVGGDITPILNNTIYATTGDALDISGSNITDVEVRDNVFYVTSGLDINVAAASEQSVLIDYNDLYATGSGQAGQWNGVNYATLSAWQNASGMDGNSIAVNPLFENIAGNDFHVQSQYGANHGGTLAPILGGNGLPIANPGAVSNDSATGPTIDRGAPTDPYNAEPAPNGGYVNLGAYGDTSQASISPVHYLLVINPAAGITIAAGQTTKIVWRDEVSNIAAGASDTDTIDLMQGSTVITSFSAPDTGSYNWTPSSSTPAGQYQIKIIRNDGTGLSATGPTFNIAAFNGIYYVNGAATGGTFTTAGGSDSNSGLDPAHPKATIGAILSSYTMQPGNIIEVDAATYNLTTNLVLTAADNGITIEGVPNQTILNRGSLLATNAYVFSLQTVTNLTLQNLNITGAYYGIDDTYQDNSAGLTITGCNFYGDENFGIYLEGFNNSATVTNNTFHNMLNGGYTTYGLYATYAGSLTVTGNTAYNLTYGLSIATQNNILTSDIVSNNTVYATNTGLSVSNGNSGVFNVTGNLLYDNYQYNLTTSGASVVASGNTIYEDGGAGNNESSSEIGALISNSNFINNNVYGNVIGVDLTSYSIANGNNVHNNTTVGIEATSSGDIITGNTIDSNGTWGVTGTPVTVSGNLIYGNTSGGIYVSGDYNASILNNTVYQTTGPAFRLDGLRQNGSALPGMTVQGNIFWTTSAPDLLIDDAGEFSFSTGSTSDYNDLYFTGTGEIAQMAGQNFTSLSAWSWELGLDVHSISADPQFVNAAGGNFHVQSTSPTIDAGNPTTEFILEPTPNGGRINQGSDGNTAQATILSAANTLDVIAPTSQQKLQVGVPTTITWQANGVAATQTLTEVAVGQSSPVGEYHAAEYVVGSPNITSNNTAINTSLVTNPAPMAVYQTFAYANSVIGNTISYQIPVPNGTYTIRLDFVEPYYSSTGARVFDIILNGTTVQSAFDIAKTAGNVINKAVAEFYTVTASGGTGINLTLKNDTANPAMLNGFQVAVANPGGIANPTANIQVSLDNGNTWSNIATNQPMDPEGRGSFIWSPTTQTAGATALVRVVTNDSNSTTGTSSAFPISPSGVIYYVNDNSTAGDSYTTAVGNNANDGKTPATPMASIEAVLNTYQPGAGAIIEVDNGTYTLFHDIYVPAVDSGVTITGPLSGTATLNRNNTATADDLFLLFDNANNITIQHLSLTGGDVAVYAPYKVTLGSSNITIANNIIFSNATGAVYTGFNINWIVTGNTIHDNSINNGSFGVELNSTSGSVSNNTVYNEPTYAIFWSTPNSALPTANVVSGNTVFGSRYGIYVDNATVSNNIVHDNTFEGIFADQGSIVSGNTIYRQTASGTYGLFLTNSIASGNRIYDNYLGIFVQGNGAISLNGNYVYSNLTWGINVSAGNGSPISFPETATNNVIYGNSSGGVQINNSQNFVFANNTVYQLAGDAVDITGSATPVTVENNILFVESGYDIDLVTSAQAGLVSDYNTLYHLGNNAKVGIWSGTPEATLAAWHTASSKDTHSNEADPMFVDPTGADAILGYSNNINGGNDDDFFVTAGSPTIAAGIATVLPATDALGYARVHADLGAYAYRGTTATPPTVVSATPGTGASGTGIGKITVVFSQAVNDVDANAPSLYSLLSAGPDGTFGTGDDISYPLTPNYVSGSQQVVLTIGSAPLPAGNYQLTIFSNAASSIHNLAGIELDGDANGTQGGNYVTTFSVSSSVVGRFIFYNDSFFDGVNTAANSADDNAIATDKQALLPGGTATFANYTSYTNGINGIMVDISALPTFGLSASDFTFLVGNSSDPSTWSAAPAPQSITIRSGAGANGSSRVEIIWANGAIKDEWLQVTVHADANTGLSQPDVFYFGNAVADSGNSTTDAAVTIADALAARGRTSANAVSVTNTWDYNRDGLVNGGDVGAATQNLTAGTSVLQLITVPSTVVNGVVLVDAPGSDSSGSTDDSGDQTNNTGGGSDNSNASIIIDDGDQQSNSDSGSDNSNAGAVIDNDDSSDPSNSPGSDSSGGQDDPANGLSSSVSATPIDVPVVITTTEQQYHLVFATSPIHFVAGKTIRGRIVVYVEDASGKIVDDSTSSVILSINDNTLSGKTTRKAQHGKVVFSALKISTPDDYTLTASDGAYAAATAPITVLATSTKRSQKQRNWPL